MSVLAVGPTTFSPDLPAASDAAGENGASGSAPPLSRDQITSGTTLANPPDAYTRAGEHVLGHGASVQTSVADMSLPDKVAVTIASAAKDATGALGTVLRDPHTQAMLAGGAAALVGAQVVPGVDIAVDAAGAVGTGACVLSAPQHAQKVGEAFGKLKAYMGEVGNAKSQADLDKASKHFAEFIKLGGSEALDALGAGGVGAATRVRKVAKLAPA